MKTKQALLVQSAESQLLFFPRVMSFPTNQVEEQECPHPSDWRSLK